MENNIDKLATCDNCARLFRDTIRRHYCFHCDKYFFICPKCSAKGAHCRYCGIPLKHSIEKRRRVALK